MVGGWRMTQPQMVRMGLGSIYLKKEGERISTEVQLRASF